MNAPQEQRIHVTQATAGMILARPVLLPDRMVLVGEGATLTDAMISQMLTRGITRIVVRGQPNAISGAGNLSERLALLDERFSRVQRYPFMRALRDVVARTMARKL